MRKNTPANKCKVDANFGGSKEVVNPIGKVAMPGAPRKTKKALPNYRY